MKKKKKTLAAVVLAAVLAVTGCSGGGTSTAGNNPANPSTNVNKPESKDPVESKLDQFFGDDDEPEPASAPASSAQEPEIERYDDPSIVYSPASDFEYWYDEAAGGTIIRGYVGAGGDVFIPKEIEGKPVTLIDKNAFTGNSTIKSVYVPSSVEEIGDAAFYNCPALETFSMGVGGTKVINYAAFRDCVNLENVTLTEGLTTIGRCAFSFTYGHDSKLKSIVIPDTVTKLGDGAFERSILLENVTLGKGITAVGGACFSKCSSLKSIEIPDNITALNDEAFQYCENLETVKFSSNLEIIGKSCFSGCKALGDLGEIPATCRVYSYNFYDSPNVKVKFKGKTYTKDNIGSLVSDSKQ